MRVFAGVSSAAKEKRHENRTHTSTSSSCSSVVGHFRLCSRCAILGGQCSIRVHRGAHQHGSGTLHHSAVRPTYRVGLEGREVGSLSHYSQLSSTAVHSVEPD